MKKEKTVNTFNEGLIMDLNPIVTPNNVYCNALNATITTMNGNENVLQNDMGNGRVETAYLPEGYIPLGTTELGGIIYIVSYNPLKNKCQIGSFPSPERNLTSSEISNINATIKNSSLQDEDSREIISTLVRVNLLDRELSPGDQYTIYSTNNGITNNIKCLSDYKQEIKEGDEVVYNATDNTIGNDPLNITIHVISIGEDGKITYLDDSLKWYGNYYIKEYTEGITNEAIQNDIDEYRTLVNTAYNTFSSKTSGRLALLFEVEVIDTFSVTWDAKVDSLDSSDKNPNDKSATIKFYFNYTSRSPKINPTYIIMQDWLESNQAPIESFCKLPNPTDRKNDGSDPSIEVTAKSFGYLSSNLNTTWNYMLTPAMKYGTMPWLKIEGSIDLVQLGSGKINLTEWRYFRQPDSIILNWGLEAYPEINKTINGVTFEFIPFDCISQDSTNKTIFDNREYVKLEILNQNSYSGYFQNLVLLGDQEDLTNVTLYKDYLYLVKININYDTGRTIYRWLYTTDQWNEQYLTNTNDFNELTLDDVLNINLTNQVNDNIEHTSLIPEKITLPEEGTEYLKAQVNTVNYYSDEFIDYDNVTGVVNAFYEKYSSLFKFDKQNSDIYNFEEVTHSITTNIQHNDIPLTEWSKIEPILSNETMSSDMNDTILTVLNPNDITSINDKAIDSFTITPSYSSNQYNLCVKGVMFSRVLYPISQKDIIANSVLRPLILYKSDLDKFNLIQNGEDYAFNRCFIITSHNEGGENPDITAWEGNENSGASTFGKGDNLTLQWYNVSAYNEFLNPRMNTAGGPFQIVRYDGASGSDTDVNFGQTSIHRKWGIFVKTDRDNYFIPIQAFTNNSDSSPSGTTDQMELPGRVLRILMSLYTVTENTNALSIKKTTANTVYYVPYYQVILNITIPVKLQVKDQLISTVLVGKNKELSLNTLQSYVSNLDNSLKNNITITLTEETISQNLNIQHIFNISDRLNNQYFNELSSVQVNTVIQYSDQDESRKKVITKVKELPTALNSEYIYVKEREDTSGNFNVLSTYLDYQTAFNYISYTGNILTSSDSDYIMYLAVHEEGRLNFLKPSVLFQQLRVINGELCFKYSNILNESETIRFWHPNKAYISFVNCSRLLLISI